MPEGTIKKEPEKQPKLSKEERLATAKARKEARVAKEKVKPVKEERVKLAKQNKQERIADIEARRSASKAKKAARAEKQAAKSKPAKPPKAAQVK